MRAQLEFLLHVFLRNLFLDCRTESTSGLFCGKTPQCKGKLYSVLHKFLFILVPCSNVLGNSILITWECIKQTFFWTPIVSCKFPNTTHIMAPPPPDPEWMKLMKTCSFLSGLFKKPIAGLVFKSSLKLTNHTKHFKISKRKLSKLLQESSFWP